MIELYARSIVRRWKQEIEKAVNTVLIFSPYLTSETAELVISTTRSQRCEIYTLFTPENFITGASSIRTLSKLLNIGCDLYHLPYLHAKVVLVDDEFASVGSQNLTSRGASSLEMSLAITDQRILRQIRTAVEGWLVYRRKITGEMVAHMEELVAPFRRQYRKLQRAAAEIDKSLQDAEKKRREVEEYERKQKEQEQLKQLQQRIAQLTSYSSKWGKVHFVYSHHNSWWGVSDSDTYSLMAPSGISYLEWIRNDGKRVTLDRIYRYLCLIENTGKLGWARVVKTRITFVERSVSRNNIERLYGHCCKLTFEGIWNQGEEQTQSNLIITLDVSDAERQGSIKVDCWFSIDSLKIQFVEAKPWSRGNAPGEIIKDLEVLILKTPKEFRKVVL